MDGRKDALNDAALEREIESLLSVEPSADFVARVRSRVGEEPMSTGWGWQWPLVAAATAMTLTAVAVASWPTKQPALTTNAPVTRASTGDVAAPAVAVPHEEPVVARVPRQPTRRVEGVDAKAFDRLLATIREPNVVFVLNENAPGPPWLETSSITIQPIVIEPVPPVEQLEGGEE